jgi:glycosyltransferase involved in cell wall biosynthesis
MFLSSSCYVFADPIGRPDSGITGYVEIAARLLRQQGIDVSIVTREPRETIEAYRNRLAEQVVRMRAVGKQPVVEAPETDAATAAITCGMAQLHIRLHCSRQLGAFVQGQAVCQRSLRAEQKEIRRADIVSAPSQSAIAASRILFDVGQSIHCYPNPPPEWSAGPDAPISERRHVLFVGRFHALKGAYWVLELARRLPDTIFVMVVPDRTAIPNIANLPNIRIADGMVWDKVTTFRNASAVIIPSIYETASMVGIEAIAAGVPVLAWSHLGIAEYAPTSVVARIRPFDIDAFADAISKIANRSRQTASGDDVLARIRQSYLEGVRNSLTKRQSTTMPEQLNEISANDIRATIIQARQAMPWSTTNMPRWRRKLRKLRRTPALFFRDSALGRILLPDRNEKGVASDPEQRGVTVREVDTTSLLFTEISDQGRIRFRSPPSKPEGLISVFLYPSESEELTKPILEGFGSFDDFRYIRPPMLQVGKFNSSVGSHNASSIVNRIDLANKEAISSVDNIILLNPPSSLVTALRSCGTRQRILVVITDEAAAIPDPWHTDVLIIVGEHHPVAHASGWRRKIVVSELTHVPIGVRRAIQEGAPKQPNMFLPLIGFTGDRRAELLALDAGYHQGVIRIAAGLGHRGGSMVEITSAISKSIKELAVTESVYLRYRNLCDCLDDEAALQLFLSYSLYDGVMFDVRV